jgi:hypothetical protein
MSSKITASSQGQASHEGALRTPQNENKLGTSILLFVVCMALFLGAIYSLSFLTLGNPWPMAACLGCSPSRTGSRRPSLDAPTPRASTNPSFSYAHEETPGRCPGGLSRLVLARGQNQSAVRTGSAAGSEPEAGPGFGRGRHPGPVRLGD